MDSIQSIIDLALAEDLGLGDITTDNLIPEGLGGVGKIVAKESLVVAGLDTARRVFATLDPSVVFKPETEDGKTVAPGDTLLTVEGPLCVLLKGERTALNFLQRLSGIATNVRAYVEELAGSPVRLVDTRKTTPGWRGLEKYAVRVGGAFNHRTALYDGVLIKDNHIAVCGGIEQAVSTVRRKVSHLVKIEVEVTCRKELEQALSAGAEVIMLDNMDIAEIRESVEFVAGRAVVEVSGSVVKKDLKLLADTGVDIISSGALTHQARSVDLSMRIGTGV